MDTGKQGVKCEIQSRQEKDIRPTQGEGSMTRGGGGRVCERK